MSSTFKAPYEWLGKGGDYQIEVNFAVRIYNKEPYNQKIPDVGELAASLKGGQRTNYHGHVPLLDGNKDIIGLAEIVEIVSARPKYMELEHIQNCGFPTLEKALDYVKKDEEFERDGVMTVFYYKITEIHPPKPIKK